MGMSREKLLETRIAKLEREMIQLLENGITIGTVWRKIEIDNLTRELLNIRAPFSRYDKLQILN